MSSAMPHPRYAPHRAFISPAGRRGLWVVVFMLLVFELAFIATPEFLAAALPAPLAEAFWMGESRWAGLAQLASFGLAGLVFVGALRAVQRRGVWSLLGPRRLFWPMMLKAAAAGVLVLAIQFAAPPYTPREDFAEIRPLLPWLALVPAVLLVSLVQVGTEEIVYRGFLQQELAVRGAPVWLWMGLPSLLFGLAHFGAGTGMADAAAYVIWAACLGLACADLTARTGSLGPAIGLHLANNAGSLLVFGEAGAPLSGFALFLFPPWEPLPEQLALPMLWSVTGIFDLALQLGGILVLWLAARVAIRA